MNSKHVLHSLLLSALLMTGSNDAHALKKPKSVFSQNVEPGCDALTDFAISVVAARDNGKPIWSLLKELKALPPTITYTGFYDGQKAVITVSDDDISDFVHRYRGAQGELIKWIYQPNIEFSDDISNYSNEDKIIDHICSKYSIHS